MLARIVLILILANGLFIPAHAGTVSYAGVWVGAIGNQKVRVCFTTTGDSQYYYIKHMRGIRLRAEESSGLDSTAPVSDWTETAPPARDIQKTSGHWHFENLTDGLLVGNWSNLQGGKKLKIKLEKVEALQDQSCGKAFYGPIEDSAPERTKHWNVFLLPSSYAGASRFNAYVRSWLKENTVEDYECQIAYGNVRELELASEVLTAKVLVIRETLFDVYCGGAHNAAGTTYQTFDPQTGRRIDSWRWIRGGEEAVRAYPAATSLRTLIEKLNPTADDENCREGFYVLPPYPTKDGFMFPTSFGWAARGCDSAVLVPYDKLKPHLSGIGKAMAESFAKH